MKFVCLLCGISTLAHAAPPDADEAAYPAIERFVEVLETVRKRHPDVDRLAYDRLVNHALEGMLASNGPIRRVLPVDVRQSMANGGGPACLRLRVVADPAAVDPRFMLDAAKAGRIERVIAGHWPEAIAPHDLGSADLAEQVISARTALLRELELTDLV